MITVMTKLHNGIYKSHGGGVAAAVHTYSNGPRNLLSAIRALDEEIESNKKSYGGIGCGRSWLEIDGKQIHVYDLEEIMKDDEEVYGKDYRGAKSRTQKARELLSEVKSGYDINKYNVPSSVYK